MKKLLLFLLSFSLYACAMDLSNNAMEVENTSFSQINIRNNNTPPCSPIKSPPKLERRPKRSYESIDESVFTKAARQNLTPEKKDTTSLEYRINKWWANKVIQPKEEIIIEQFTQKDWAEIREYEKELHRRKNASTSSTHVPSPYPLGMGKEVEEFVKQQKKYFHHQEKEKQRLRSLYPHD